ncbi:hypothetical protein J7643_10995 [bacterium]|nr:hypothetical protein [bacterium]
MPRTNKAAAPEPVVATATVEPMATVSMETAKELDANISAKIKECSDHLARAYLELGKALSEMNETKGYIHLGFLKWEAYLESKKEFGRTYLSYLYKLGQAGNLERFLDIGIPASKFIEFAKKTEKPEKISQLIEETWESVKDKSVRDTAKFLGEYVSQKPEHFKKPKATTKAGRPKLSWKDRFTKEYSKLSPAEQDQYLFGFAEFKKELKAAKP